MDEELPASSMRPPPASEQSCEERAKAIYVFANEKGGMKGVNYEVINKIIMETSGNSSYTQKQLKQDAKVDQNVELMRRKLQKLDDAERRVAREEAQRRTEASTT